MPKKISDFPKSTIPKEFDKNVIEIECDPTLAIKDKWIAYKKDSYNAVLNWFSDKMVIWSDGKSFEMQGVKVMIDD